jgi:hypothetical protein
MDDMAWVVLAVWALVAAIALPLGRHAATETPLLGLQALLGLAGLTLAIIFVAAEPAEAIAWVIAGIGALGAIVVAFAAAWLTSDQHGVANARQQSNEETDALLAGVELTMFVVGGMVAATLAGLVAHAS